MLRRYALCLVPAIALTLPGPLHAAAFYLLESSDSRIGNAFAGTASAGDDASTVFFGGAAMTRLNEPTVNIAGHAILTDSDFDNQGSTTATDAPLTGSGGNSDSTGVVPNLYFVTPLPNSGDRLRLGLGINAPFGSETSYDDDWVGRYQATDSSLRTININPEIAFKATDSLSLGVGLNYQRIDAELENQVDSFGACLGAGGNRTQCGSLGGFGNQAADSSSKIEGDDDGVGLTLSLLYSFNETTRAGLSWRQGIDYTLTGEVTFDKSSACTANPLCSGALDSLNGADVSADLSLPDIVNFSVTHRLNADWRLDADIAWYQWNSINQIRIETDSGREVSSLDLEYENTFRYAVGVTYSGLPGWDLRTGIGFDESPISGKQNVSPRIPSGDRTHLALGASYDWSDQIALNIGYLHVRVDSVDVENTDQGNTLRGQLEDSRADVFTVGMDWRF